MDKKTINICLATENKEKIEAIEEVFKNYSK